MSDGPKLQAYNEEPGESLAVFEKPDGRSKALGDPRSDLGVRWTEAPDMPSS